MTNTSKVSHSHPAEPVWVTFPIPPGAEPPALFLGDSYLVRRASGEVLWCVYVDRNGCKVFEPCNSDGESIDESLEDSRAVMVLGYGPGVAAKIIAAADKARDILGPLYCAEGLVSDREPILSGERDYRPLEAR